MSAPQANEVPGCYLWLGIPRRSHICNVGDQQVNSAMRRVIRKHAKKRMVDHVLGLRAGTIPDGQRLDTSEKVMKNLLLANPASGMGAADTQGLILSSWKSVLNHVDPISASGCLFQKCPFLSTCPPLQVLLPPSLRRLWLTLKLKTRMGQVRKTQHPLKLTKTGKS